MECQIIELIGSSTVGFKDAVKNAVLEAETKYKVHSVDVVGFTVKIQEKGRFLYRADCKLAVD